MLSALLVLIAAILFIPVFVTYLKTGLVPNFPTLIVSGFVALAAIQSFFAGLILTTIVEKDRQDFEFKLQMISMEKETKPMSNTKKLFSQIIKFGFVGGTAFVIDAGLLFLLTEFCGIHYLISGMISFTASVIYNYILSVKWVFDAKKDANKTQEFIVFIVLSVIGLGINQLFMWLFVDMMHIYYMLSKIIATVIVMVYNFITRKIFLEKK